MQNENLIAFLYLLLRDQLPAGEVEAMIMDVEEASGKGKKYSNPHLEAYARELAQRINPKEEIK